MEIAHELILDRRIRPLEPNPLVVKVVVCLKASNQLIFSRLRDLVGHRGPGTSIRGGLVGAGSIIIIVIGSAARKDTGETGVMTSVIL